MTECQNRNVFYAQCNGQHYKCSIIWSDKNRSAKRIEEKIKRKTEWAHCLCLMQSDKCFAYDIETMKPIHLRRTWHKIIGKKEYLIWCCTSIATFLAIEKSFDWRSSINSNGKIKQQKVSPSNENRIWTSIENISIASGRNATRREKGDSKTLIIEKN